MTSPQIRQAPELRKALEQLPKPNGTPEIQVSIEVPADDRPATSARAGARLASAVVAFHRGVLATPEGSQPVWVYEGPLALARDATPADHEPARVAAWLREQLGPRCVAVDVGDVEEHEAMVRIAATIGGGAKPD
jgi:hypothetical protein